MSLRFKKPGRKNIMRKENSEIMKPEIKSLKINRYCYAIKKCVYSQIIPFFREPLTAK